MSPSFDLVQGLHVRVVVTENHLEIHQMNYHTYLAVADHQECHGISLHLPRCNMILESYDSSKAMDKRQPTVLKR